MSPRHVTFMLCSAEILGLAGVASFSALVPTFISTWFLTNTQAGWISAVYFGAYVLSVPFLTGITDRFDARIIMLLGALLGAAASFGFAWLASGFWSSLGLRFVAGISLAAIYMPGLKLLSDHTEGPLQTRYISFYTASFSIGASLSYLLAGEINTRWGWSWAFGAAGLLSLAAVGLIAAWVPPGRVASDRTSGLTLIDLGPVFRRREALAYILGYAAHMWELFGMRSWMVAFLEYSRGLQPPGTLAWSGTQVMFLINLIGLPASIGGNELSRLFGRRKVIIRIMLASVLLSAGLGFTAHWPYPLVLALCLLYGIAVLGDSAALTAGAVAFAPDGCRGATLAVHSTLGFGAAFLGPLMVGVVLDFFRGPSILAWGMAFVAMGAGCALGPLALLSGGKNAAAAAGDKVRP